MTRSTQRKSSRLPTTSLYLQDAINDKLAIDWETRQFAENSYRFANRDVVVRYASAQTMAMVSKPLLYLIDDDLLSIPNDPHLPDDYRDRIRSFLQSDYPRLIDAAEEIVVSSEAIQTRYQNKNQICSRLNPYWRDLPANKPQPRGSRQFRVAWLASRSHLQDLASISEQLSHFLKQNPSAKLTVLIGKQIPSVIKRIPQLKNLKPMPWVDYRKWLIKQRFDVVIHPLIDTAVNRARSHSKWQEIAITGAVPLISNLAPWTEMLSSIDQENFLIGPNQWQASLTDLIENPEKRQLLASRAHCMAVELNEAAKDGQIAFWQNRLNLSPDS